MMLSGGDLTQFKSLKKGTQREYLLKLKDWINKRNTDGKR